MATKKANTSSKPKLSVSAKIDRMIEREDATVKAYASVNIGGAFVIKDIAVVDGQKGMFARMPFRSYKTGSGETKYSDIAFALTDEARQSLNDAVIGAYREALEESEDELPDEDESPAQKM
jgi:stage V sporulation protein G